MKYILGVFLLFAFNITVAQQMSYSEWKAEAKENVNLLPEYGNVVKTESQLAADNRFIQETLTAEKDPHKASEYFVKRGFDFLYKGDLNTAMTRFNQAWLLDNKNENAYWGYAAVYFSFNDTGEALKQLNKGLIINPKSDNILTDIATISYLEYYKTNNKTKLQEALTLLTKSYGINPTNQNTLFKLSVCYFLSDDCAKALKYHQECMKLGGKSITAEYTQALTTKCKN